MSTLYQIDDTGKAVELERAYCVNEGTELQQVLEENLFLLPGDQINPEDPRRWLLVKREMPVPSPTTGADQWSVDLFLVDQDAIPTFVECKRFRDTRSRREVVGQVLEYAANGHYYWDRETIREHLDNARQKTGQSLEDAIGALNPSLDVSVEEFLETIENNLREGQVRLIFCLEEAPNELKSIVDFLNRQMERSEVLLVELRQYDGDGQRFLVPTLFGFTEEARRTKRKVVVSTGNRRTWSEQSFFEDAASRVEPRVLDAMRRLYALGTSNGWSINWGTGMNRGSLNLVADAICRRSLVSVYSDGEFRVNCHWLNENTLWDVNDP